jgi:hypothetical protein
MYQGNIEFAGGPVQKGAQGRIIGGVEEDLASGGEGGDSVRRNALHQGLHQGEGIEFLETALGGGNLGLSQILLLEKYLMTQIRQANPAVVYQANGTDASSQKIKGGGRPQTVGSGNKDPGGLHPFLGFPAPTLQVYLPEVPSSLRRAQI